MTQSTNMSPKVFTCWTPELKHTIDALAQEAGFDLTGIAPATSAHDPRFATWIDSGRAGEMDYLKRCDEHGNLLRSAVQVAIPWARSVLVCAFNYNALGPRSIDPVPPGTGWIARYAWSGKQTSTELAPTDYHDDLLARLRTLEVALHQQTAAQTRCYVDTGPILERDLAAKAGVGWIGKNTCVLTQTHGSWLLLGVIATSLAIPETPAFALTANDRCGSCTRCIDACPTDALIAPHQMDASRCIAYLTIEKKGPIPEDLRASMGRQVFGCDICQDVCPWNTKAPITLKQGTSPRPELINPTLEWLAKLDNAAFKQNFKGSPLERTGRKRLHRNVAIAMGNSHDPHFLSQLQAWSTQTEDPVLAESARWAIHQLVHA
jgi:epoxyqueuosine reductase